MPLSLLSQVGPYTDFSRVRDLFTPEFMVSAVMRIILAALIILAARVLVGLIRRGIARGVSAAVMRSGHGQRRLTTLQGLLTSTLAYTINFVAFIFMLFVLGVPWGWLAPLLGAASVLGLAVGFGAQRLVRDIITGLFILGEGQFDVGDWVTIGSVTGQVQDIGLRITRLRDEEGREYVIANGDITQVFNASRGLVKLAVEFSLQRSTPLEQSVAALQQIADETLREFTICPDEKEQPSILLVGMEAAKINVQLSLWVPVAQRDAVEDALRRRVLSIYEHSEDILTLA